MQLIRFWVLNARPKALPQSVLPAILSMCLAYSTSGFSWILGVLSVLGVITGHLGMNLFDDYFDYRVKGSEFRDVMARKGMRSRIAKCSYITSGQADLKQLLIAGCIFGVIAMIIGLIIFTQRGSVILYFALLTAVLGVSYSSPPLKLSYRGVGEFQIGLMFGPLLMTGVYYASCGHLDWPVFLISIPVGLLVANIVYTHSIMDYEPDKEVGKMTFAVLLNNKKGMLLSLFILLFLSYTSIAAGVVFKLLSPYYLLTFLTLPMAISLFYLMIQFVNNPRQTFSPRFWMGPMGNWERFKDIGIDWFMIRWLLARNLLSFFCLINILVNFTI
jgi:1,4-dihydroxy-2-naphthoate octaprenyltransferase